MRQTALVTGGSGGIGAELARLLASDGLDLVLVARGEGALRDRARELEALGSRVTVMGLDLASPRAVPALVAELERKGIEIDVLVNNAGFGNYGPFERTDLETELDMIQLNVTALTELTKLLLPPMLDRRRGRILNVASTAAFQPGPLMAVYYATKAYVLSFSEALANELEGSGVTVTAFCPGPTATGFAERANLRTSKLFRGTVMDPREVGRAGHAALLAGRPVAIAGRRNAVGVFLERFLPRRTVVRFVRALQERRTDEE